MQNLNVIIGLVFTTIIFIAFFAAFGLPIKYYLPQSNIDELEQIGKDAVANAKADLLSNVWFMITSFWTMIKTIFNFTTIGITSMLLDIGGMFNISETIIGILIGVTVLVMAYYGLKELRG